jgi:hypothetical protein
MSILSMDCNVAISKSGVIAVLGEHGTGGHRMQAQSTQDMFVLVDINL